jgi:hypothetical protein
MERKRSVNDWVLCTAALSPPVVGSWWRPDAHRNQTHLRQSNQTYIINLPPPQVYYYPGFYSSRDGARLTADVTRNLSRPTAWEAVMRIRCSRGLRISSFHGHFFNRCGGGVCA